MATRIIVRIFRSLTLTITVFGVIGFIYIAGNAWFHPESLSWPLTHLLPYPREDIFGMICFGSAMFSFFIYNILKEVTNR